MVIIILSNFDSMSALLFSDELPGEIQGKDLDYQQKR
jgi:hypothetical protein